RMGHHQRAARNKWRDGRTYHQPRIQLMFWRRDHRDVRVLHSIHRNQADVPMPSTHEYTDLCLDTYVVDLPQTRPGQLRETRAEAFSASSRESFGRRTRT